MSAVSPAAKAHRRAYVKAWQAANPRDRRAYKAAYDAEHKAEIAAYLEANRARLKANHAAYYKANRERLLARVKAYTAANHERVLAYHVEHYAANAERLNAQSAAWRIANPEKKAHTENRRRARKAGNGGSHTLAERQAKWAEYDHRCAYCREAKPLTVDHVVPISRGGTDDIANIVPACRSCNSRKNARTAEEFAQKIGGVGANDTGR